jgi:hypothetical protein
MVDGLSGAFTTLCVPVAPGVGLGVEKPEEEEDIASIADLDVGYYSRFGI